MAPGAAHRHRTRPGRRCHPKPSQPAARCALARPDILAPVHQHAMTPKRRCGRWPVAAAGLAGGEHAVLQVLARPVTGARLR